jgi:hypothetical protein
MARAATGGHLFQPPPAMRELVDERRAARAGRERLFACRICHILIFLGFSMVGVASSAAGRR